MAGYKVVSDYTQNVSSNTNVQVFVRARPTQSGSDGAVLEEKFGIRANDPRRIEINQGRNGAEDRSHAFSFDKVFWTNSRQEDIFSVVCQHQVEACVNGYNSCAFAYGQTGSGKVTDETTDCQCLCL